MTTLATDVAADRVLEHESSAFLDLPPELRLSIYEFALLDSPCITIGHAQVVGKHHDVIHHLHANNRTPYPGLPQDHTPQIASTYDASLLSITHPATIPASPSPNDSPHNYTAHQSLLLTNRQIHSELTTHLNLPINRQTSIFASYPYGLHILKTTASSLLSQAQSVHIAGQYTSGSFNPVVRAAHTLQPPTAPTTPHNASITPNSPAQLGQLIASTFGPSPIYSLRKLEMRVYYPGSDSYSTVWGDDDSPTVVALRNISTAEVGIEVWRGTRGTGIYFCARRNREGERKRVVSTVWRKLEEGRRGEEGVGSWVVDPKWPKWEDEYDMSEGPQGNVFTSVPVDDAVEGASAS